MSAAVAFVVLLSLGEAVWSPRTYDYTLSISPLGKEAAFAALSTAPLFVAKVPVGLLSGYLLDTYMPANGVKRGQILWLIVGLLTLSSPILITVLERWVREPESGVEGGGEGGRREGDRYETLGLSDGSELEEEEECGGGGIKKLKGFTIVSLDDEGLE